MGFDGDAMIRQAKLIKLETADGQMSMNDGVPLGTIYRVDDSSKVVNSYFNTTTRIEHEKEMILDIDAGAFLPTELLEIEK